MPSISAPSIKPAYFYYILVNNRKAVMGVKIRITKAGNNKIQTRFAKKLTAFDIIFLYFFFAFSFVDYFHKKL